MDLKKTLTDPKAEREGIWITLEDARLKVARMQNPAALAAFQEKTRLLRGKISDEKQKELMTEIMSAHILLDWENLSIGGDPLPYSTENAFRILNDFPEVRRLVLDESQNLENFLAEKTAEGIEGIKKN